MIRSRRATCFAIAATCLVAASSSALTTSYATRTDWANAVGAFETEDFETTPAQHEVCTNYVLNAGCAHEYVFDAPKLDIVVGVGSDGQHEIRDSGFVNGSREFSADLHGQILVEGVTFDTIVFPQPILAFAVDLAGVIDLYWNCAVPECEEPLANPLTFTLGGSSFAVAEGAIFFGAVSDIPFSTVVLAITDPLTGTVVIPSLDDISFVPIPEPSTALLLGLGLIPLALRRRRIARR